MKRTFQFLAVVCLSWGLIGCGQTGADSTADTGSDAAPETTARLELDDRQAPVGITPTTPPEEVVTAFLDALRNGDSNVAEALLTRRAHEETRKRDLAVRPLGSPDATFQIGVPEYLGEHKTGAHVNTTWTETQSGETINYDIVWALRRQQAGWRVAGMGAQLAPGQPVVYLNFEDPDDMLAKWRQAEDKIASEQSFDSGVRQAQAPQPTGTLPR